MGTRICHPDKSEADDEDNVIWLTTGGGGCESDRINIHSLNYYFSAMIDLQKLDYIQLKALDQQVAQQIGVAKRQEVQRATAQIQDLAKALDMTVEQMLAESGLLSPKSTKTKAPSSSGVKAPALYQNPADASQTWSGRGRQPSWVTTFKENGGNLDDVKIKQ